MPTTTTKKPNNKLRKRLLYLAGVLVLAAAALGGAANVLTEYSWFQHLGFDEVYLTVIASRIGMGVGYGLLALALLTVHILLIRKLSSPRSDWSIPTAEGDIDLREVVRKVSTPVVILAALVVAAAMGVWASRHWEEMLKFLNATPFGVEDPVLNKDIGYYLFYLPLLQFSQEWLVYLSGICAILSASVYLFRGAITVDTRFPRMSNHVRMHLLFSIACVVLVIGWGFRIEMYEVLFSKRGVAYGATFTDVYANLPAYRILIVICALCALSLLYMGLRPAKSPRRLILAPAISLGALVAFYLIGVFGAPTLVQRLIVNPNELEKERPYLGHAITHTRSAYGLERIEVKDFPANAALDAQDLKRNQTTIDNIKIWDRRPLRATYRQLQVIRLYYDFPNISIDRYRVPEGYWQVMLAGREMVHSQLPVDSQRWVNRHLQYTHGYGVCLSPVNKTVGEGLPDLWIKDIPPESRYPSMRIDRPEIYYGLKTSNYALVRTTEQEFDYPKGDSNQYSTYQGEGGVPVGSFFSRLLFAIRMADTNLFFTSHLTEESRILFNRNVQERVHTLAPFLMLDEAPYLVVAHNRLYWVQDAYTMSYRYPYSQPTSLGGRKRINYIRNSIKVVVDAYSGRVSFYQWGERDPLATTYRKIFPTLFKDRGEMPAELAEHVRYPKDLFTIQARMYESFHMTDPRVFYNQEDKWSIAGELPTKARADKPTKTRRQPGLTARRVTEETPMDPYYMIMRLPDEADEEFLLMVPYTPSNKDNMVAWMTARCDGEHYGKLRVYTFPKQKLIYGPLQVEARIDQNDYISQWITLRNQQGSKVFRGDLLVIPIEQSILYVEPIYLEATQSQLPELKRVIVAFENRVKMSHNLTDALKSVFGVSDTPAPTADDDLEGDEDAAGGPTAKTPTAALAGQADKSAQTGSTSELVAEALKQYRSATGKLKEGDWAGYGTAQDRLERVLERLAKSLSAKIAPRLPRPVAPDTAPAPQRGAGSEERRKQ